MEKVRSQSEETSQNKIRRIQEKMQNEINLAEQNETEMQRKFSEARTKTNQVTEELIAEKHKSNLLAVELNEKEQRLHKLMTERFFISFLLEMVCFNKWFLGNAYLMSFERSSPIELSKQRKISKFLASHMPRPRLDTNQNVSSSRGKVLELVLN